MAMCKNYIVYKSDRKYYNPAVVLEKWLYSDIQVKRDSWKQNEGHFLAHQNDAFILA